jgi:hypothetical protein
MLIVEISDVVYLHLDLVKRDRVQEQNKPNSFFAVSESDTLTFLQIFRNQHYHSWPQIYETILHCHIKVTCFNINLYLMLLSLCYEPVSSYSVIQYREHMAMG